MVLSMNTKYALNQMAHGLQPLELQILITSHVLLTDVPGHYLSILNYESILLKLKSF